MKRSEIATIILVAGVSAVVMFTLAQSLLGDKVKRTATIEQASQVSEDIVQPSKRIFNSDAINPTVEVCVEATYGDTSGAGDDCKNGGASTQATTEPSDSPPVNSGGN